MNKVHNKKNALIILSHQMDANGELNNETLARIELGVELFRRKEYDFIITSGIDSLDDSHQKIGEVVADKIIEQYSIEKNKVLVDVFSRDTVGDAFFLRRNVVLPRGISSITVITTEYHVERADIIFKNFFSPSICVTTIGTQLELDNLEELLAHEKNSYRAFLDTFENVDFADDAAVFSALSLRHPLYNGEVYEKLNTAEII